MKNEIKYKSLPFKEFSRNNLFQFVADGIVQNISIDNIDIRKGKSGTMKSFPSKSGSRYLEDKKAFITMLFNPEFDSLNTLKKSPFFDYMIGLHQYISSNSNFCYTLGLFKNKIESFDKLLDKWSLFLESIVEDIKILPSMVWGQQLILEIEGFLRIYIRNEGITFVSINFDKFNNVFLQIGNTYNFRILLTGDEDSGEQLFISGKGNGKGVVSNLFIEFKHLNELVISIKEKQNNYIRDTHENEFA